MVAAPAGDGTVTVEDLVALAAAVFEGSECADADVNRDGLASYDMRADFRMPAMTTPAILRTPDEIEFRQVTAQRRVIGYEETVGRLDLQ